MFILTTDNKTEPMSRSKTEEISLSNSWTILRNGESQLRVSLILAIAGTWERTLKIFRTEHISSKRKSQGIQQRLVGN